MNINTNGIKTSKFTCVTKETHRSENCNSFGMSTFNHLFMVMKFPILFLLVFLLNTPILLAQFYATHSNDIPVYQDGSAMANPWAGGINAGQISTIDVNQDGLQDVFIFDRAGNKPMIFLNNNSNDPNSFEYSLKYSQQFPPMRNWALLRDFNCDGKKDIFTYNGIGGFRIYENISATGAELEFTEIESNLQSLYNFPSSSYYSNIFISSVDIPAVDDLDGDGDLDIIVYSVSGVLVEYHKNFSVEETGSCDSLMFVLGNRCYGFFSESAFDNSISLHDEAMHNALCPMGYNVADPTPIIERPDDIEYIETTTGPRHSGTTILTLEMTQQLPKEIVLGDISHYNLTALTNSSTAEGMDTVVAFDPAFPSNHTNSEAVDLIAFPASYYEDMNNDGIRDLIVSPNNEWASENTSSVWYYQNHGLDDQPDFVLQQKDLFQQEMIDVGEGATAFFMDYNADGLQDLIIGNKGYFVSPGVYESKLALYENTGSAQNPEFTFITDDFAELAALNLGQALHPAFGDIDNDGDTDMLIGTSSGRIYRFNNIAGPGSEVSFVPAEDSILKDVDGNEVDPGQFSTPQLIDLNGNGLLDLVMGERNGKIHLYENVGTAENPSFELTNDFLGNVETAEGFSTTGYSVIQFFDMDGERYLMTGAESGKIRLYSNITGNLDGAFNMEENELFGLRNGIRSTVVVTDINNDEFPDLFTGNFSGGLLFFKGGEPTAVESYFSSEPTFNVFPNPATSDISVSVNQKISGKKYRLILYNALGKIILEKTLDGSTNNIAVDHLSAGIYMVQLKDDEIPLGIRRLVIQ